MIDDPGIWIHNTIIFEWHCHIATGMCSDIVHSTKIWTILLDWLQWFPISGVYWSKNILSALTWCTVSCPINANPSAYYTERRKATSEGRGGSHYHCIGWLCINFISPQFVSTLGTENIPGEFSISEPLDIMTVLWPSNKIWTESLCRRRKTAPPPLPLPPPFCLFITE